MSGEQSQNFKSEKISININFSKSLLFYKIMHGRKIMIHYYSGVPKELGLDLFVVGFKLGLI